MALGVTTVVLLIVEKDSTVVGGTDSLRRFLGGFFDVLEWDTFGGDLDHARCSLALVVDCSILGVICDSFGSEQRAKNDAVGAMRWDETEA